MTTRKYIARTMKPQAVNPWHHQLVTTIKTGRKLQRIGKAAVLVNAETGEYTDTHAVSMTSKLQDKEEFVKMFAGGISAMFDLSKSAQDLFRSVLDIYLLQKFESERVFIHESELKNVGYTRKKLTRTQAINQLISAGFIAPILNMPNFFWCNPTMFFKGDRMTVIRDYAVKNTAAGDAMQAEITQAEQQQKQMKLV